MAKLIKKVIIQCCKAQNRRSGEMANHVFDTYTVSFMTHGRHTLKIASDIAMATLCAYTSSKYALTQWKCFCGVVKNVHVLISQVKNQTKKIQMLVLK